MIALPEFPGWHLIGQYESDVGSWLLHHEGQALLLEVPEGLKVADVELAARRLQVTVRYITASHNHEDHLDRAVWNRLKWFSPARFIDPGDFVGDGRGGYSRVHLGSEPLWLIPAPKHSSSDIVIVFRGVAMTGDIELGTLDSVNAEVPEVVRRRSMDRLRDFPERSGYRAHSVMSAHLNDVRINVDWPSLFTVDRTCLSNL